MSSHFHVFDIGHDTLFIKQETCQPKNKHKSIAISEPVDNLHMSTCGKRAGLMDFLTPSLPQPVNFWAERYTDQMRLHSYFPVP